jgi:hypothetical protein
MKLLMFCLCFIFGVSFLVRAQPASKAPEISNGIKINTTANIKIVTAYLYYDGGKPVPDSNRASLGQNVNLLVQVERGSWIEKEGKVSIGASEKIATNTGAVILNEADLFENLKDISAEDAQYVTLKAVITSMTKKFNFFLVSFVIWDKWGTGKITGSYRLKIR